MDDIDYLKSKIIHSQNEARCAKKNFILKRNLSVISNSLTKDFRRKTQLINNTIEQFQDIRKKLPISTGSAFQIPDDTSLNENQVETKTSKKFQYLRTLNGAQSAMDYRSHEEKMIRARITANRSKSTLDYTGYKRRLLNIDSHDNLESLKKFLDKSNRVSYSDKLNDEVKSTIVKDGKPKRAKTARITRNLSFKEIDLVEWNKHFSIQTKKKKSNDDDELVHNYEFKDDDKYRVYLRLCETRDSLEKLSKTKIESNQKIDPIFSKRYRQFSFARSCNRAPEFDHNDLYIRPLKQKTLIRKGMNEIIDLRKTHNEKNNHFQKELFQNVEKIRQFNQKFEV
ncbi:unnamed protein product [Brachionus calyciflorus]|uniref:Uncharacterized protein n=1 Tax=Brachionus calyciflorus TaxID=104777 RepID=A0A813P8F7_9BILA|nr:unnamed protein product [Brachionus calyciflorus]